MTAKEARTTDPAAPPRPSRRARNKARTRAAIVRAAGLCFLRRGVDGATMDEVAETADVARATLFNYFATKSELVSAVAGQLDEELFALIDAAIARGLPLGERVRLVFVESAIRLDRRKRATRTLVAISERDWATRDGADRFMGLADKFGEMLAGSAGETGGEEGRALAETLASAYVGLIRLWREDEGYPLQARLERAARLIVGD